MQIKLKKQKFNHISKKMINEYGKKYEEIVSKALSKDEIQNELNKLLEETISYDEKNHQAILRLDSEQERLTESFHGKVQDFKTIHDQMQNLHLFDKDRYLDRKSVV